MSSHERKCPCPILPGKVGSLFSGTMNQPGSAASYAMRSAGTIKSASYVRGAPWRRINTGKKQNHRWPGAPAQPYFPRNT